ncbi:MAG: hypothetical protein IAF02_26400 [Anaerolineae bacterium]|nr:hypothetical protein [Anaerolineae bacterium]
MDETSNTGLFDNGFMRGSVRAIINALLLRTQGYKAVNEAPIPSRRGFGILLVILIIASVAQMIGAALNSASMSQVSAFESSLYTAITELSVYTNAAANNANFADWFSTLYDLFWKVLGWMSGYRSPAGILFTGITFITSNLFAWLTYGFIGYYVAKAFGAKVEKMGDYLGLMGLAFAPFILYSAEIIPGLVVPATFVTLWFLAAAYQAIKSTYDLSWWRTALILILPFPLNTILLTLTIQLGVTIGVAVSKMMMS